MLNKYQELKDATIRIKAEISLLIVKEYENDNISKVEKSPINEYLTKVAIKVKRDSI